MTVLHQEVAAKTEPRLFALRLAVEHAVAVGRAAVRVVAAFLAAEVHARVAGVLVLGGLGLGVVAAVLADEAFEAGPGFDQGAVGGEMLVAGPAFLAGEVIDFGEEEPGPVGVEHAVVVLGEGAVVEAAFAPLAVEKPEPEQMVADLLAQETFARARCKGR